LAKVKFLNFFFNRCKLFLNRPNFSPSLFGSDRLALLWAPSK